MKKAPLIAGVVVLLALVGLGTFWFWWRPIRVREGCYQQSLEAQLVNGAAQAVSNPETYTTCLKAKGVSK
jgi:hypothetical protein